jgi:hypothetical protein
MQNWNDGAYSSFTPITPSSTTTLNCRAIYVGGAGNVTVANKVGGTLVTFTAPAIGSILPVALDQGIVDATTTATLLVALA